MLKRTSQNIKEILDSVQFLQFINCWFRWKACWGPNALFVMLMYGAGSRPRFQDLICLVIPRYFTHSKLTIFKMISFQKLLSIRDWMVNNRHLHRIHISFCWSKHYSWNGQLMMTETNQHAHTTGHYYIPINLHRKIGHISLSSFTHNSNSNKFILPNFHYCPLDH